MSLFSTLIICTILAFAGLIILKKMQIKKAAYATEQKRIRKQSIKPSLSICLKKQTCASPGHSTLCIENNGLGRAADIIIHDFYNPEEKDWHFKFNEMGQLDPGEEKTVDFDFYAGGYRAANKHEQLWMFDPDHEHDFAAHIKIDYRDIDGHDYTQTIIIGRENENQTLRKKRLWMIRNAMSRKS